MRAAPAARTSVLLLALAFAVGCARPTGRFEYVALDSASEGTRLRHGVYLPPRWDRRTPLPIVVLLHGAGDDATSADRRALVRGLDRAIERGDMRPFILVTPEGDLGFWLDWHDGSHRWRSWVMDEVVPQVQRRFPTVDGPDGLHLVGVSMGGGGGLQMWLAEPERFGSITVLSAPILDEADTRAFLQRFVGPEILVRAFGPPGAGVGVDPYSALQRAADLRGSRLLFGAARHDRRGILASNEAFHRRLEAAAIPHRFVVFAGNHSWRTWSRVLPHAICVQLDERCRIAAPR